MQIHLPSHVDPVYTVCKQSQAKVPPTTFEQAPSFMHGVEAQGSTSYVTAICSWFNFQKL